MESCRGRQMTLAGSDSGHCVFVFEPALPLSGMRNSCISMRSVALTWCRGTWKAMNWYGFILASAPHAWNESASARVVVNSPEGLAHWNTGSDERVVVAYVRDGRESRAGPGSFRQALLAEPNGQYRERAPRRVGRWRPVLCGFEG